MIRFYIQNLEDFDEACEALDSWRLALLPHAPHLLRKRFRIHLTAID